MITPPEPVIEDALPLEPTELLRRISFDVRGGPPSDEEYARVQEAGDVPEALIDEMLASDAFLDQVESWHAEVLWPNISRYRMTATALAAVRPSRVNLDPYDDQGPSLNDRGQYIKPDWEFIGQAVTGDNVNGDIGADPALVEGTDEYTAEELRERYMLSLESSTLGSVLRGGDYHWQQTYCDMSFSEANSDPESGEGVGYPSAQYPAYSDAILDTATNRYTVPAELSGSGRAYEATYYSEDTEHRGLVRPLQDWRHCQNYCYRTTGPECADREAALADTSLTDREGHHCFRDQDEEGDPTTAMEVSPMTSADGLRHAFDVPGMRCPENDPTGSEWERVINTCDFANRGPRPKRAVRDLIAAPDPVTGRHLAIGTNDAIPGTTYNRMYDGWVWAEHYWSRGVKVRTCAYEAQQREVGLIQEEDGSYTDCAELRSGAQRGFLVGDPSCGCGPLSQYCAPSQRAYSTSDETRVENRLRTAIEQEPLQIIRDIVDRDEDYLTMLTTRRSFVNGPLALAWRIQWQALTGEGGFRVTPPSESNAVWDGVEYQSEEWVPYERDERHSGILTTLEFLLRFPTARSRVSQFRRVFACSNEFDYAPAPDPADTNPDIGERTGCASCHSRLEEDGMWFARYPDRSGIYLTESEWPIVHEACRECALGDERREPDDRRSQLHLCNEDNGGSAELYELCNERYASWGSFGVREEPYAGHLWPTIYRDPALYGRIEEGPRGMVESELAEGNALQMCAAESAWERLVRRPATQSEIARLSAQFEDAGRGYRALVRAVVTSEAYRSTGPEETP